MTIAVGILSFFTGIALTLYLLRAEIYHGQKVGYGENDIHPDNGVCVKASRGMTPLERKEALIKRFREESN